MNPRQAGYHAGQRFLKKNGLDAAKAQAKKISDQSPRTLEEYQYVDGFMNAVAEKL